MGQNPVVRDAVSGRGAFACVIRVKFEATSFRELVSQCRHQLAQQYLQDAELSLQQIAYQLGFEEQSSFQKAFKSWQGCSPGIFRQRRQMAVSRCHPLSGLSRPVLQVNYGTN